MLSPGTSISCATTKMTKRNGFAAGPVTLIAGANALHAFHNRTDRPARFLSASVYYHEVALERVGTPVDINDPAPANGTPTEAQGDYYLGLLKDVMNVHMYFPQQNARNGLEALREIENRNKETLLEWHKSWIASTKAL